MSDRLAAKIKENAGKPKYSSLNLNQTYKGNKVEIKTSTGATRHGLQSLGKIGSSRRIPPPANLPSLKSENSGNDPTVSLVPTGGGGWGSAKDKSESSTPQNPSPSTTPAPQTSQGSVPTTQQPLLQPQRPIQPSSYPSSQPATQPQSQSSGPTRQDTTTTTQEKSEAYGKTWGTISQNEAGGQAKPYSHQPTPYFNREFPSLGGQDNGDTKPERKEYSHGQAPIIRNTHEPPWMERSGPGPPSHGHGRDHEMFNGGPTRGEYHRRPPPDYQHRGGPQGYPPHHYNNSHHPSQGGRPPPHGYSAQDQYGRPYQRPGPGQRPGMRVDKRYESERDMENKPVIRTAVLRPEDIQAMDDEDDDGGWAGAHGEVDYTAKLNFEDFDDDEKEKCNKEEEKRKNEFREKKEQKAEEPPAEAKKESDQGKESTQYKRPQDTERPPQQPKSAWGEAPQGPPQYGDGQYGRDTRSGPPQRPFDSHRPPPQGQGYHGGSAPWNMQYPPPQRAPQGQYSPVSGSPPAARGPPVGTPPKQDSMGPPMRREGEQLSDWVTRKQEMHAAVERARMRREQEEQERQAKTKAAAMMKLKELEERHGRAPSETSEETKEGAVEKPRTDSLESGKSDREIRGEEMEMREKTDKDTELPSEQKTGHYPASQHPDQKAPHYRSEDSSRRRNDSDSSDASKSSGSRQYFHHPQRNIPPRFQQQRQQQQQQYQQQQLYQATHPMSHPQKEVFDVLPPHVADSGPVSPSGAKPSRAAETAAPKRIMKRTDSSSTAGDDVASVKSLDSIGEREKGSRQRVNSGTSSISEQETRRTDARDRTRPGDSTVKIEDKETRKEAQEEKKSERLREKTITEPTVKDRPDQEPDTLPRKREYRSTERKPEEAHKRKRDENEDDYDDRRNKITNRDRHTDSRGRTRPGSGYRGRGRGSARGRTDYRVGGSDNRQRGARDTRQGRDSRDSRDYRKDEKTEKTREPSRSEDRNKDVPDKISSEERDFKGKTERPPLKKDEKTQIDKDSQERKTSSQDKSSKDSHEKDKGERRTERPERKTDRYERRDERERGQRKPSDQRRTDNKENKAETRKAIFPARDVREEDQKMTTQRSNRDGQDRRQDRERNRDQDDYYKDRARDYRDRDKDRERSKLRDQDRFREAPRSSRGPDRGHRAPSHVRGRGTGSARGGRRGTGRLVGSGRITQRTPKKEELISDEEDIDDSASESSSYTTATSASEERLEVKEKPKERPRSASQSGSTTRTPVRSIRGSRARGGGSGFSRPRREQEKPPRFQKQQERAAAQRGTSSRGGFRTGDRGRGGRGRGRGRGRGMASTRDADDRDVGSIQPTEDWEDEVNQSPKEQDKSGSPQKRAPKSGDQYSSRKTLSRDESGRQGGRRDGGQSSSHSRKTDSFLAEKQVKVEGSKQTTSESKGALPAAKSTDLAQGKKSSGTPKDEKRSDYSAVDNIDSKTQKRTDTTVKKANIQLYDLHNVAGVICIDDIPDDASDISSSGFVEVTSKRTQKELKEKQREEDERKKRNEEKASQRSSEKSEKFKKNQTNKPPRFSKQHQNASATGSQGKAMVSKLPSGVALDGITGLVSSGINSNSSSTNSTKRNSPVTVERPPSPQPPPVFNAWNKPLSLVTPAKAPGSSLAIASNVPDPLAVGSGKPSRHTQPSTVIPVQNSLINSNIEDKSAEDELKEITKEIESMAPTEEQEEIQDKTEEKSERSAASSGTRERRHDGEKKSQPKPQRAPRFDKSSKRKNATEDGAKKEHAKEESKKEKSRLAAKQSQDTESSDAKSTTKRKPGEEETLTSDDTVSDTKGSEDVTEDTPSEKKLAENDEGDRESEKGSVPRKDSDYSVDSEEQASEDSSVFSSRPLSVDITDSSGETQDRPPTPVSPIFAEMKKRMNAARMAWHQTPSTSVGLAAVSMETTSSWPETSSTSVSMGSKDGNTIAESNTDTTSEYRENTEDSVNKSDVSKPTEVQFSGKKPGGNEQQNVCKVKPQQQQQPVKPQQSSSLSTASGDDRGQADLESMVPTQPVLHQDHLLRQNVHNPYQFQIDAQLLLQQRQQQQFVHQPLQSIPQSAQVAANSYQLSAQMQQVRQSTSASSLSQSPQELFQAPFMTNNLYTAGGFPVSQPYVSLTMVATTSTPSYVSTSTRTQATSVMALQGQQPKTINSSMFGPSGSPAQTVYMPFDPQSMGGAATLLNFNQQSQQAQRQMMGNQALGFADVIPQQALQHAPSAGTAPQQIQNPFSFHTKPANFDGQQGASLKSVEPSAGEYNQTQSDMVKHINAKPFEPPKRLSTPTPSNSTANSGMGLLTSAVNPNLVHVGPSPPNMGALSHSPPMQTSYISNRPVSMSPVDPNVSFAAGANSFAKHAPMGHFQLSQQQRQQTPVQQFTPFQQQPVHIKPQQLQQHQSINIRPQGQPNPLPSQQQHNVAHMPASGVPHQMIPRQYGHVGPSQPSVGNQRFPGPIQRPPTSGALQGMPPNIAQHQPRPIQPPRSVRQQVPRMPQTHKVPILSTRPQFQPPVPVSSQGNHFKVMQHQKMLEETRMFFATDQQSRQKSQASVSEQGNLNEMKGQSLQQQGQKQGQVFPQTHAKQQMPMQPMISKHQNAPIQEGMKMSSQQKQSLQQKQVPLAPTSGVHHQNKPPRMSQENKPKQTSQDKKDKKEENKSHIIELPRKKPQDNMNKPKPNKTDSSKSEDTKQGNRMDGKLNANKRSGPVRITPMMQKTPSVGGRPTRPTKPRPQVKNTNTSVPPNKPKTDGTATTPTTTVVTGAPSTAATTTTTPKPPNDAVVSSKGKDIEESSPKDSEEIKATVNPLTTMTS